MIEVWGSQKEVIQSTAKATGKPTADSKKSTNTKSTKELMAAEKAKVCKL